MTKTYTTSVAFREKQTQKIPAPTHTWNEDGSTCIKFGDKDWIAEGPCSESKISKAITNTNSPGHKE